MGFHSHSHGHDHGHGHGHDHDHDHGLGSGDGQHPVSGSAAGRSIVAGRREGISRRLSWVLAITVLFMVAEIVGGILSGSLALLADAGHMFSDSAALILSLVAVRLAQRPPTQRRTYGLVRFEVIAALVNGAALLAVSVLIVIEAAQRFRDPVEIDGIVMLSVASMGFLVNLVGVSVLHGHSHDNLNMRGAYLHVLGDLLGSVGAIGAAVVVLATGWSPADPIISVVIALLILVSAWNLVKEATEVLLESAPAHIDVAAVLEDLRDIEGLEEIHDVHIWTLTSGFVALSGHGVVDDPAQHTRVLEEVRARAEAAGIEHVTFQLEFRTLYQLAKDDR